MSKKTFKIVAPMYDHSDYAWRILSARYGADMCFTEMIHSESLLREYNGKKNRNRNKKSVIINNKNTTDDLKDSDSNSLLVSNAHVVEFYKKFSTGVLDDRLVIQISGNNLDSMCTAGKILMNYNAKYIDINLGCPQNIAKRGNYGAHLALNDKKSKSEDGSKFTKISSLVKGLSSNGIPVSCKIRIFEDLEETLEYCKILEKSGCQMLTVHGRTVYQKGKDTGLADWNAIKKIKEVLKIPVIANGNILDYDDVIKCVDYTKCDGVMVAESHLQNPTLFCSGEFNTFVIFKEYLDICKDVKNSATIKEVRCHAYNIFKRIINKSRTMFFNKDFIFDGINNNCENIYHNETFNGNDIKTPKSLNNKNNKQIKMCDFLRERIGRCKNLNDFYKFNNDLENMIDQSLMKDEEKREIKILKATSRSGEKLNPI
ncbi:Dihydrouridine synthase [Spraguea lophii 42_110]|uniref:tRNA-dihydrouridine(16/17) synthase [NAD(P)(+)] n=1 Tax=Spraguea lophii (strain 42_110) TaxID=1358809 RepID=S7XG83_SPRLO|nr:Dihydrouridine synthase [Spraguea lophii 42_110]